MTALCPGGGPSAPKPGTSELIAFNGSSVALAVTALGFPELAPVIAVIASGVALETPAFCATDPPADPNITLEDVLAVMTPQEPVAFQAASKRLLDWFLRQYWFTVCECTGGVVTPPRPPTNLPPGLTTNPGLPTAGGTAPCWNVSFSYPLQASTDAGVTPQRRDLNPTAIPPGTGPGVSSSHAIPGQLAFPVPAGVNRFTWTFQAHETMVANRQFTAAVAFIDAADNTVGGLNATIFQGQPLTKTVTLATVPAGAVYWLATGSSNDDVAHNFSVEFDFFCGPNGPGDLVAPCCPPDPLVSQYLQLILNIVSNLYNVSLPAPVISWRDGTKHFALENAGSFTFSDPSAIGVRVDVTRLPSPPRTLAGVPTFYWDMGFITPVAIGVPTRGSRLVFEHQTFHLPDFTDALDFTLLSGTMVDITELIPVTA